MSSNMYMIMFGIIEIIFSQIPDFDQVWWLSIVAAVMSFTYSTVGLSLGISMVAGIYLTNHWYDKGDNSKLCVHLQISYIQNLNTQAV